MQYDLKAQAKAIYAATRNQMLQMNLPDAHDPERVKETRDKMVFEKYGLEDWKEMSGEQRRDLLRDINEFNEIIKEGNQFDVKEKHKMESRFWECSLDVSIHYVEFGESGFNIKGKGYLSGKELRKYVREKFNESRYNIPNAIFTFIVTNYTYKKSNEFLIQGDFKKSCRNWNRLYVSKLSKFELDYLIRRWEQIQHNINHKTVAEVSQYEIMSN